MDLPHFDFTVPIVPIFIMGTAHSARPMRSRHIAPPCKALNNNAQLRHARYEHAYIFPRTNHINISISDNCNFAFFYQFVQLRFISHESPFPIIHVTMPLLLENLTRYIHGLTGRKCNGIQPSQAGIRNSLRYLLITSLPLRG